MTAFIFLFLGLLFVFLEFYIPGGIMTVLGTVMLIAGIVAFATQTNSEIATAIFIVGTILLVGLLIRFTLRRIPRAKQEYSIYLPTDQEGYYATKFDATAIGKTGIVVADLKPAGYILVEGKKHQAISQTGYLQRGTQVVVIRGEEDNLIVKTVEPGHES